ncbi:MAG: rhamnulokinase [Clostridiales bacterium]|nr:rhamnulokinase [Clostridiales bacterium]MDK2934321.1 rhamnulokinase [Clostridiales bacterium]
MQKIIKMLAFDFGASSGRAILGTFNGEKLTTEEIHRFSNDPVQVRGALYWDILRLFYEIKQGILKCVNRGHKDIASIAIDTWGVDFGLLDENGNLLGNPYHYRDSRTEGMMEEVFKIIPRDELYKKTGIEFMWFNTIYQLYSMKYYNSPLLDKASTLLLTPDLFNYFLTGVKKTEYSIASTTQLLDAEKRHWSTEIIEKLGLPKEIFTEIVPSGTIIGNLSTEIAEELGVDQIPVIATAGHDTQAAIAATPTQQDDFVYISCGTWSLMGVETENPILNEQSLKLSFTNEGGVDNKISLLKNIMGLWLVQECRRHWFKKGEEVSFDELGKIARQAEPFVSFVNPNDKIFISPGDMPNKIKEFCRKTNQPIPESKGQIIRCITQSLALEYKMTVESLEKLLGKELPVIHMVGGGIKDRLLCQFTANATGKQVIAGPVEATSIGNLMVQVKALGAVSSLKEMREIVKNSFSTNTYQPQEVELWNKAYEKYKNVL